MLNTQTCYPITLAGIADVKPAPESNSTAGFCLGLPGQKLYLTPLLTMKKFRKRGNKDGAITAFYQLEEEGLGKVMELAGYKGTSAVSTFAFMQCLCSEKLKHVLFIIAYMYTCTVCKVFTLDHYNTCHMNCFKLLHG